MLESPESIEVVDEEAAHEGLQCLVDVVDGDALLDDLVAIHVDELLRHAWEKRGVDAGDFGALARGGEERIEIVGKKLDVIAGAVFEDERETAGGTDARNGGGRKRKRYALRNLAKLTIDVHFDLLELLVA